MERKAIIGATIGAALGAAIWAVVGALTGYELGIVAWGVGGLVGIGAQLGGSSTRSTAFVCALLALGAIFMGKLLAVDLAIGDEMDDLMGNSLTPAFYEEDMTDARDFVALASSDEHAAFMVSHGFTEQTHASTVPQDELDYFRSDIAPGLQKLHEDQPTFEQWQDFRREQAEEFFASIPTADLVIDDLGLFDIIFAILGVATAYRMALGAGFTET